MQPVSLDSTEEVRRRPLIVKSGSRHSPLASVPFESPASTTCPDPGVSPQTWSNPQLTASRQMSASIPWAIAPAHDLAYSFPYRRSP